eukprot:TRINITY_DN1375_c0_g1_i1.p2 TRINITY_DN1375_c0_g1~~TRINITY_DN1375_c0_g1_i1.p2  ORF type:complete len:100 (-),score=3.30 TRINITY_DN1375_c0_g1_i1:506-805(-)
MPSMGDDWRMMWGAKVKLPLDMPDDILKDAIDTSREVLDKCHDFEAEGETSASTTVFNLECCALLCCDLGVHTNRQFILKDVRKGHCCQSVTGHASLMM